MASTWVGLLQPRRILVSGYVALRLPSPESVVAWFVIGSGNSVWLPEVRNEPMTQRPSSPVVGGRRAARPGGLLPARRRIVAAPIKRQDYRVADILSAGPDPPS